MIEALAIAAVLTVNNPTPPEVSSHREVSVSRSVPNRWQDSGVTKVWADTPRWIRDLGLCIRRHESINSGHYKAQNGGPHGGSTAAGAYQMIQSTHDGNAKWTRVGGKYVARKYVGRPASDMPQWIQDATFIHSIEHGGIKAWAGTGCPGT